MDTTTTVPIYNIPKDSNIGIDQSAVPTVFASGVSPDSIPWSTAEDIIRDIVREGPHGNRGQSFNKYEHARLPVQNDFIHGNSYGGCGYNVWSTASPPPVSGVNRSSGVGKTVESFTIVLGGQIGTGKCYGGSRKPTEGCWFHDVKSPNSGTVRNVIASDVSRNVEYWCGSRGLSGGRSRQAVCNSDGPAGSQVHDSDGPVAPSVGSEYSRAVADVDLPFLYELRVLLWQKRAIGSVTMLTF